MTARVAPQLMSCAKIWVPERQKTADFTRAPKSAGLSSGEIASNVIAAQYSAKSLPKPRYPPV
jgi:hypothetical protein